VARGDAAGLLRTLQHALDSVAVPAWLEVAGCGRPAVGLGRDHRHEALEKRELTNVVPILALVGQHEARLADWHGEQGRNGLDVGHLAARRHEARRASLNRQLGRESSIVMPPRLRPKPWRSVPL